MAKVSNGRNTGGIFFPLSFAQWQNSGNPMIKSWYPATGERPKDEQQGD